MAMAARTTAVVSFAICCIVGVGCCWRGAVANGGGSCCGCVDNGSSCGVALNLSSRFFGALAGARFFFGFRPRLLGTGQFLPDDFDEVRQIFSSRGAYARFKDLLDRRGALDHWYDFEAKAEERALRTWCDR